MQVFPLHPCAEYGPICAVEAEAALVEPANQNTATIVITKHTARVVPLLSARDIIGTPSCAQSCDSGTLPARLLSRSLDALGQTTFPSTPGFEATVGGILHGGPLGDPTRLAAAKRRLLLEACAVAFPGITGQREESGPVSSVRISGRPGFACRVCGRCPSCTDTPWPSQESFGAAPDDYQSDDRPQMPFLE